LAEYYRVPGGNRAAGVGIKQLDNIHVPSGVILTIIVHVYVCSREGERWEDGKTIRIKAQLSEAIVYIGEEITVAQVRLNSVATDAQFFK
jgi:hypothetical protein